MMFPQMLSVNDDEEDLLGSNNVIGHNSEQPQVAQAINVGASCFAAGNAPGSIMPKDAG